jgi:hypothetical protein
MSWRCPYCKFSECLYHTSQLQNNDKRVIFSTQNRRAPMSPIRLHINQAAGILTVTGAVSSSRPQHFFNHSYLGNGLLGFVQD